MPLVSLTATATLRVRRVIAAARVQTDKLRLLTGMTGRVTRFVIENDPALVSPLVAQFRDELIAVGLCDVNDATRVGVALEEALLNAIYHGNLEVSSKLKEDGDGPFIALARERRAQAPYADRRVREMMGGYDFARDLAPIINLANFPSMIVVHPTLPVKSINAVMIVTNVYLTSCDNYYLRMNDTNNKLKRI